MNWKRAKSQQRKPTRRKRSAPTAARQGKLSVTDLQEEVKRQTHELELARRERAALAEVLRVISSSPGDLEPVFQAMLENATRLCSAQLGNLLLYENDVFRYVAMFGAPPAFAELRRRDPIIRPRPGALLDRIVNTKKAAHVADIAAENANDSREIVELAGARSVVLVPMLREGELIGTIGIYRQKVQPFTEEQIALLTSFARQAVIAIENTRLLNELRQRTDDLSESLERQTATSEVLQAISGSAGELQPVFNAMLANATRLCQASYGLMLLCEGDAFRSAAVHGPLPPTFIERWRIGTLFRPDPDIPAFRAAQTRQTVQVTDLRTTPAYLRGDPFPVSGADVAGIRTMVAVPMIKDDQPIGVIAIYRQEVRPFTDKQIELVQTFADQAVIAIENTRLLNELRESLQQQTATSEVLQVISSSPGELEPVFEAMLANAIRTCQAGFGNLLL